MTTKTKSQEKNKMSEIDDQILKYYDIKKRLGKGAYGIVWKCIDRKNTQIVAVKKIFDAFRNETDAQRTFREIMFLRAFRNHPNVIQLFNIHKATNNMDIYLTFEFMESDLHNVIKRGSILKDIHKRYVMYQLLNAVKYIHSGNVIHRDLKPSNVLIDSKCRCKIADFGLARSVSTRPAGDSDTSVDPTEPILTDYVATRWYRAPEILIASKRYTKGIDMWSLGCILGEMIRCKPLFPGSSTVNQIEKIVASLPEITDKDIQALGSSFGSVLLNQPININEANPKLEDLLAGASDDAKQLIKSLLVLDPVGRLTAKEALSHKYIEKFRHSINEMELNSDILPPFRDDVQLTVPEYRSKLYEIMSTSEKGKNIEKSNSTCTTAKSNSSNNCMSSKRKEINVIKVEKRNSPLKLEKSSANKLNNEYEYTKYMEKSINNKTNSNININNSNIKNNSTTKTYQQNSSNTILPQQNNFVTNNSVYMVNDNTNYSHNHNQYQKHSQHHQQQQQQLHQQQVQQVQQQVQQQQHQQQQQQSGIKSSNSVKHFESSTSSSYSQNSTSNNDGIKLQPLSKFKYCKISTSTSDSTSEGLATRTSPPILDNQLLKQKYSVGSLRTPSKSSLEKRHSIDCTYHCTEKQNQLTSSNTAALAAYYQSNINGSLTNLKRTPSNRTSSKIDEINQMNSLKHTKNIPSPTIRSDELSPIISDGHAYYEKRMQNLEDRIQKHKSDVKAMFDKNRKNRTANTLTKTDLLNDLKMKAYMNQNNEKSYKSKLTIIRPKPTCNNDISSAIDFSYAESDLNFLKSKKFNITANLKLLRKPEITS